MAKSASSAKADLAGARKAVAAALAALTRADWDALDAALPETVARAMAAKLPGASTADVRRALREVVPGRGGHEGARPRRRRGRGRLGGRVGHRRRRRTTRRSRAPALLIVENGVWKVLVAW